MAKERKILKVDTEFSVSLKQKHPRGKMMLGGVWIFGGAPQNYTIPKGTDLSHAEVEHWFVIKKAIAGAPNAVDEAAKKAAKEIEDKKIADQKAADEKALADKAIADQIQAEKDAAAQKEIDDKARTQN